MRRRRILLILLGCLVAIIGLVAWPREREPAYRGRSLTEWLLLYPQDENSKEAQEAAASVRQIGTNALPWLLKWIREDFKVPSWKITLYRAFFELPRALTGNRVARSLLMLTGKGAVDTHAAMWGFHILGPQASPAIPELKRLMNDPTSWDLRTAAMCALVCIGEEGLPSLLSALGDQNQRDRYALAYYIGYMTNLDINASAAAPVLARCLKDPDSEVAVQAAESLGRLAIEPSLVVPPLTDCLQDSRGLLWIAAANSLAKIGEQSRSAVPSLVKALDDPDLRMRVVATNALRVIAPEVLQKPEERREGKDAK